MSGLRDYSMGKGIVKGSQKEACPSTMHSELLYITHYTCWSDGSLKDRKWQNVGMKTCFWGEEQTASF